MKLVVKKNYDEAARWAAAYIAEKIGISAGQDGKKPFRLGLPTGSSPLGIYKELIAMYKAGTVSFRDIITYNMDEYLGLPPDHPQSYRRFMWDNFFSHIDIRKENVHIPDGNAKDPEAECLAYEQSAASCGIDLFLGGMGRNGHLAFNEPGSSLHSKTRIISLTEDTRIANARFFDGDISRVPEKAISVGIETILSAEELLITATGSSKAHALKAAVEGGISQMWPVSFLQTHPCVTIICDEEATEELKVGTVRHFMGTSR